MPMLTVAETEADAWTVGHSVLDGSAESDSRRACMLMSVALHHSRRCLQYQSSAAVAAKLHLNSLNPTTDSDPTTSAN